MAFKFYPGIHMPQETAWDAVSYPNEFNPGAVRTIVWPNVPSPTEVRDRVNAWQTAGKYVIVCLTPGNNIFSSITPAAYAAYLQTLIQAGVQPDAWELGNEPGPQGFAVTGPYWPILVAGANKLIQLQPSVPRILAAPFSDPTIPPFFNNGNTYFKNNGLDVRDLVTDFAIHLYAASPSTSQGKLTNVRGIVDGYANPPTGGGNYSQMPLHITEFGWTVYAPPGENTSLVVTPHQQALNLTAMMAWFRDNRTTYKIRSAHWFVWQDIFNLRMRPTGYYGLKKAIHTESVNSPIALQKPSPINKSAYAPYQGGVAPNGYREAKAALDAFQSVYDATVATPPVVTTVTPPTGITVSGATLKGTVDPNGKPTTFYFDYGPTTSYGTTTVGAPAGSGSSAVAVSQAVTGLATGQVYHYRCRAVNSDGADTGIDRTFTTLAPPLGPTVNRGPVTSVTTTTATIWGSVNPNGAAVTDYHFQYGLTTSYGGTTTAGTLPSGNVGQLVGAGLTGLTPGATYHYRLVATNSQGTTNGADGSFTVTAPPTSTAPELSRLSVLSTLLSVEITTADSRSFRWDAENSDVQNRPLSISFATQQGDGFAEASCELPRPIGLDWSDLHLLDRFRLIGADASVAYEGRVAAMPRRMDSEGEFIGIQATGLMSTARDRTFTDIIVDRLGGSWQEPSLPLRKATLAANKPLDADYTASVDSGSIHFKGTTNKLINAGSQAIVEYIAPNETKLASFQYMGTEGNVLNESSPSLRSTEDDTVEMTAWATTSLTLDGSLRTATPAVPASIFGLRMNCGTAHGDGTNPNVPAHRQFEKIAVYSDHGITLQGNGDEPDGVFASDVIANLIARFCPLLNADGVAQTTTVISHLVFDTPTTPFDAFATCNAFHLWSLGSWEGGKVIFEPADFGTIDWQIRSDDMGVTFELQGDASDQFANGLPVSYTDINDRAQILWPRDEAGVILYDELLDTDPDNDANKWGYPLWPYMLELSNPVDLHGALTLGKVALSEFNRRKAPGSVNLTLGYIEDGQGNLQPGWKVRAGQTLAITDLPNDEPRLITGTSWTEDGQLQITVEQPSTRVDAVLARLETSSQARGL